MLVEYKITFQKDGITIKESIKSDQAAVATKPNAPTTQNQLSGNFAESQAAHNAGASLQTTSQSTPPKGGAPVDIPPGGAPVDIPPGGGPGAGTAPLTLIGPFILLCLPEKSGDGHGE